MKPSDFGYDDADHFIDADASRPHPLIVRHHDGVPVARVVDGKATKIDALAPQSFAPAAQDAGFKFSATVSQPGG